VVRALVLAASPHFAFCCIPFQHTLEHAIQPKVLFDNHVSTTNNISVNRMARPMEGKFGKFHEWESATSRRKCAGVGDLGLLAVSA
jgi:hypothetical protein